MSKRWAKVSVADGEGGRDVVWREAASALIYLCPPEGVELSGSYILSPRTFRKGVPTAARLSSCKSPTLEDPMLR